MCHLQHCDILPSNCSPVENILVLIISQHNALTNRTKKHIYTCRLRVKFRSFHTGFVTNLKAASEKWPRSICSDTSDVRGGGVLTGQCHAAVMWFYQKYRCYDTNIMIRRGKKKACVAASKVIPGANESCDLPSMRKGTKAHPLVDSAIQRFVSDKRWFMWNVK